MATKYSDGVPVDDRVMVLVWQLPVRLAHWVIVFSIVGLSITGAIIGNGNMGWLAGHDGGMNLTRSVHMFFAWIFLVAVIGRLIWMFMGNKYSRWDQFIPVAKERRVQMLETLKYYAFMRKLPPNLAGHNPLAGMAYAAIYALFVVQALLGIGLYGVEHPGTIFAALTSWVFNLVTLPGVRLIHHLLMWVFIVFVIQHLYSMSIVDFEERTGTISSMMAGTKIVHVDELDKH